MDESEPSIRYERDGYEIILKPGITVIKKNGLTIELPDWVLQDFAQEFDRESSVLDQSITKTIRGLRNET